MLGARYILFPVMLVVIGFGSAVASSEIFPVDHALDNVVESVEFHDTPIENVLRLLAAQNDLNLIIGSDSMGTVSLRLTGVSLRATLDAILQSKGFKYQIFENILVVTTPDTLEKMRGLGLETKIFRLKYADARDVKVVIDTAKVLSPWGNTSIYYQAVKTEASKARAVSGQGGGYTGDERLSTRSNILLITDHRSNLLKIGKIIDQIDQRIRQLLIDVHFVETILDDQNQLGFDWTSILSTEGAYHSKTKWTLGESQPADMTSSGGFIELGALTNSRFRTVLDLMLTDNRANLLSQPRITTLNNQPATIFVGVTTWIEELSTVGGGVGGEGGPQITYTERQVPIELVVVPHITHENRILLELQPKVEEITGWQEGAQGMQLPIISTRSSDSRIEVTDGETAIIGGLIKEKTIKTYKKVWLLGSLPLLGHLFRHSDDQKLRTDLTIFITTRIIKPGLSRTPVELDTDLFDTDELEFSKKKDEEDETDDEPEKAEEPSDQELVKAIRQVLKEMEEEPAQLKSATEEVPEPTPKPAKPVDEGMDMELYFPLQFDLRWGFSWKMKNGEQWQSKMRIIGAADGVQLVRESDPSKINAPEIRLGYKWTDNGLENVYRVNHLNDSTYFSPPRIILPRRMAEDIPYENSYNWVERSSNGKVIGTGRVVQIQRLIGKHNVSTHMGRFRSCVAVETVWYDPDSPETSRKRKVIWYAPRTGPVKVENDISIDEPSLKGNQSALLSER